MKQEMMGWQWHQMDPIYPESGFLTCDPTWPGRWALWNNSSTMAR